MESAGNTLHHVGPAFTAAYVVDRGPGGLMAEGNRCSRYAQAWLLSQNIWQRACLKIADAAEQNSRFAAAAGMLG